MIYHLFTKLCNYHRYLNQSISSPHKESPYPFNSPFPFHLPPTSDKLCFLSLMICLFCIFKVHGFIQQWPCMLISYTWCYVFETHLWFST